MSTDDGGPVVRRTLPSGVVVMLHLDPRGTFGDGTRCAPVVSSLPVELPPPKPSPFGGRPSFDHRRATR